MGSSVTTNNTDKNDECFHSRIYEPVEIFNLMIGSTFKNNAIKHIKGISIDQWYEIYVYNVNSYVNYHNEANDEFDAYLNNDKKFTKKPFNKIANLRQRLKIIIWLIEEYFEQISHKYTIKDCELDRVQIRDKIFEHSKNIDILNVNDLIEHSSSNIKYLELTLSYNSRYIYELIRI